MARRRRSDRTGGAQFDAPSAKALPRPFLDLWRHDDVPELLESRRDHGMLDVLREEEAVYPEPPRGLRLGFPVPLDKRARSALRKLRDYRARSLLRIQVPAKVKFCIDRRERREVLFARGRAGYSGSVKKRYWRRGASSSWRC